MSDLANILGGAFVAADVPPDEYTPLDAGEYAVAITEAEIKPTSTGGQMLVLTYSVLGGHSDGRHLKDRLNIVNANEKAQNIGRQTLAKVVTACGLAVVSNSSELVGKRMRVEVAIEPGKPYTDNYGVEKPGNPQNKVKKYMPLSGIAVTQSPELHAQTMQRAEPKQQPAAPTPTGARAWAKK